MNDFFEAECRDTASFANEFQFGRRLLQLHIVNDGSMAVDGIMSRFQDKIADDLMDVRMRWSSQVVPYREFGGFLLEITC